MAAKIFTIPSSSPFADTLAKGLIKQSGGPLALADTVIYLPTRRAQRTFGDAFARALGGAALLPQFKALGDADDDDFQFETEALELPPAIAPTRRTLLLATLAREWHRSARREEVGFAQAAALADGLSQVMDEVETQSASLSDLDSIVPGALAEHWEGVRGFLRLLETEWPKILQSEKCLSPVSRRDRALRALAEQIRRKPPPGPIIAAGSTGSIPATAELLHAIAQSPNGAVVLPGLDRGLDEASWEALDPGHPQFGMKQLLARLGVAREDVADWDGVRDAKREFALREALRPAPTTDAWRAIADGNREDQIAEGVHEIALVEAADPSEEALAISLALREALEVPGKTATLVTPDRALARRVASEMKRWEVEVDDSAGQPLSHTPPGALLCLIAEAAAAQFAPVELLALLKHPLATMGGDAAAFRVQARALDKALRGPRPDAGLDGISRRLFKGSAPRSLQAWYADVKEALAPLEETMANSDATLADLIAAHGIAADKLAGPAWRTGEAGEAASLFILELAESAVFLPPAGTSAYAALFRKLASSKAVRPRRSQHPRVAILGPLEARLQQFDTVILGGLNEGSWPSLPGADPWFSRPMRAALNLEQPERQIGQAAHDFATLCASPRVILTRSQKSEGAPTIPSRWLQRLTQLTSGLGLDGALRPPVDYVAMARRLRDAGPAQRTAKPAPSPPLTARPRKLPVTDIETWVRDPYAIYAKRILRLRVLDPLDAPIGPLERGTAIHRAMELFVSEHPGPLAPDAAATLVELADKIFLELGIPKASLAIWRPRFAAAASWFVERERERRARIVTSHVEVPGAIKITEEFTLEARADRIDVLNSGRAAIIDYKSGAVPTQKQIKAFLAPQLPLEAAILAGGGFERIAALGSEELIYFRLSGGRERGEQRDISIDLVAETLSRLKQRVADFADPTSVYLPRVQPLRADIAGDYDHLSRVREWSITGWGEEE